MTNPMLIAAFLLGLVVVSTAAGLGWRHFQGRIRISRAETVITAEQLGVTSLGDDITLVQFSTQLCSPCRSLHSVLGALASSRDGVTHLDIDLSASPALVARFNIFQTPTTFILDRGGIVRSRISGIATRDALIAELDRILVTS